MIPESDLFSYSIGQGPDLVILHGLFGSSDNWHLIAKALSKQFHVHLLDMRNHGQSFHADTMSYPEMAADVHRYLENHHIQSSYVLGHSMGGKVMMQLAMEYPDDVKKLMVIDIAPKFYSLGRYRQIIDAMNALDLTRYANRSELDKALETQIPDRPMRLFLLKNVVRNAEGKFIWQMNLKAITDQYEVISNPPGPLRPVHCPTLFIRGELSDYILDEDETLIKKWFTEVDIITFYGASHWLNAEKPQQLMEEITRWMR